MIRTFIDSEMFLLTLTVGLYCGGVALHRRLKLAILHPTLLAFVALIFFLKACGIEYEHYREATQILDFLLGMSVVALGYLMYEQIDRLRGQALPILTSIGTGCVVGVLTVRAHEAASHAGHGWETFTDAVVRAIAQRKQGIVYMLWGSYAQKKGAIADPQRNCILKAVHPSPLSVYRGFFGCRHFSRANEYLRSVGQEPIVW